MEIEVFCGFWFCEKKKGIWKFEGIWKLEETWKLEFEVLENLNFGRSLDFEN